MNIQKIAVKKYFYSFYMLRVVAESELALQVIVKTQLLQHL